MIVYTNGTSVANFGFPIEAQVFDANDDPVDISGATTLKSIFIPPNGAPIPKVATLVTDGKDGKLQYIAEAALFVQPPGKWFFYGIAESSTYAYSTPESSILVELEPGLS
jgi:hypothetical protein